MSDRTVVLPDGEFYTETGTRTVETPDGAFVQETVSTTTIVERRTLGPRVGSRQTG